MPGRRPRAALLAGLALAAAGCASVGSLFGGGPERPAPGTLGEEVSRTVPSGLRVVAVEAPGSPVVALELVVAVGSADDPPGAPGAARALDRVVVMGSGLERAVTAHGGTLEAWTTRDRTHLAVVVPAGALGTVLPALGESVLSPRWSADAVDRAIGAMVADVRRSRAAPDRLALEEVFAAMRAGTPWARAPIGSVTELAHLTARSLSRFHAAHWVPAHMTLAVAGGVDPEEAIALAARSFGGSRGGAVPPVHGTSPARAVTVPADLRVRVRADGGAGAWVAVGFAVDDASDEELAALELGAAVLGGEDGRVARALARGGAEAGEAGAWLDVLRGPATLLVWARTDAAHAPATLETIVAEAYRLGHLAPSAAELDGARAAIAASQARARDSIAGLAHALALSQTDPRGTAARDAARAGAVRPASLRDAARRLLVPARTVAVAVVPEDRAAAAERAAAGALARAEARARGHAAPGERTTLPGGVAREVLPNGARLLVAVDRRTPLVVARLALVGGARVENEAAAGASSLLAALMARAARSESPREGLVAAFAGRDTFGLEASFPAADLEAGVAGLVRGLTLPDLQPGAIEEERRRLSLAQRAGLEDSRVRALGRAARLAYGGHPYGADPAGTPEGLAALDRPRLAAFHAQVLGARQLAAVVVGDAAPDRAFAALRELLGGLPGGGTAAIPAAPEPAPAAAPARELVAGPASEIAIVLPGVAWSDEARPALEVAAEILDGADGRLARALDDRGLALARFARAVPGAVAGHFEIGATVAPDNEAAATAALLAEVARLRDGAVPARELERARAAAAGRAALSIDALGSRAAALAFAELAGAAGLVAELPARLGRVTARDVQAALVRLWPPGRERIAIAGPERPPTAPGVASGGL